MFTRVLRKEGLTEGRTCYYIPSQLRWRGDNNVKGHLSNISSLIPFPPVINIEKFENIVNGKIMSEFAHDN
jgi:hypothetical protein